MKTIKWKVYNTKYPQQVSKSIKPHIFYYIILINVKIYCNYFKFHIILFEIFMKFEVYKYMEIDFLKMCIVIRIHIKQWNFDNFMKFSLDSSHVNISKYYSSF